eukprot:1139574-Pelagomonas_calceolata.AAC.9
MERASLACWRHLDVPKSREVQPGPDRPPPFARSLSWSTPGVVGINFDAASSHAGPRGGAAGLCKIPGANFSEGFACGRNAG